MISQNTRLVAVIVAAVFAFSVMFFWAGRDLQLACVILPRDGKWIVLVDDRHNPVGCSSVERSEIEPGVYGLRLTYTFSAKKVHALTVGSDESWAGVYHAGASVGVNFANIYIRNSLGVMVDPDTMSGGDFFVMGSFE